MSGYQSACATLSMITPILGSILHHERHEGKFHRTRDGEVMLLPGWWHNLLDFGAKALGRYQKLVRQVKVDPIVLYDEVISYRRFLGPEERGYIDHEALANLVGINIMVPAEMKLDALQEIMENGGRFVGLAPQRWAEGFGRFKVIQIGEGRCLPQTSP